ncbi:transcription factor HES-5-like [Corythoichthys intestinalis]|uniref:transcription factor HES-5-like n=1 Tax=Corythoichthys intestinalis TaxID=161448 RepID=UPI0025A4E887|nr:transcription factor HES-5-like [Corythoichthys intestinalis]XP_061814228.1 transcription factor HES-5-like [Nerophis lumbriciformis]
MAPTISLQNSQLTLTHKIRKPLVEKLRRERINSCIEQLKSLLAPEFLQQQPDSKMEKAEVLEMTVCVLKRLRASSGAGMHFGASCEEKIIPLSSVSKMESPVKSAPWRPW